MPWPPTTPSQGENARGSADFYALPGRHRRLPEIAHLLRPFATGSLRDLLSDEGDDLLAREALVTVFDLHLLEPELRPAAAMVCTETVWAAAAQDPRPRLLVVDEVWSDHAAPGRGGLHGLAWRNAPVSIRLGLQFITQDVQDLLSRGLRPATDHRAIPAGRCCRTPPSSCCSSRTPPPYRHRGRSLRPARRSCNAGFCLVLAETALLLARGQRFPGAHRGHAGRNRSSSSGGPAPGTSR